MSMISQLNSSYIKLKQVGILLMFLPFLTSCIDQKEDPIPFVPLSTQVVELGENYQNKVYYSLENKKVVKMADPYAWDLAFDCSNNGFKILVNSANKASVAKEVGKKFETLFNFPDSSLPEYPRDNNENSSIGHWGQFISNDPISYGHIYLIGRGTRISDGKILAPKKMVINSCSNGVYSITYANLDNSNIRDVKISKSGNANFVYFSMEENKIIEQEPDKSLWEIEFTRYTAEVLPNFPYLVNGILFNPSKAISVFVDSTSVSFDKPITKQNLFDFNYTPSIDAIGYDWKTIDFQAVNATYKIKERMYFIKMESDQFYKLKFVDFYRAANGKFVKGYPTFLLEKLKI